MLRNLKIILQDILKTGFNDDSLYNLENEEFESEGIFKIVNEKKKGIIKTKDIKEVVSLLSLIDAIKLTMTKINVEVVQSEDSFEIKGVKNFFDVSINEYIDVEPVDALFYAVDYCLDNKEVYDKLIEWYETSKDSEDSMVLDETIRLYGKSIAKYIIETYDFKTFKKVSGKLLVFCGEYYPREVTDICLELLEEDLKTTYKRYIYIAMGFNSENSKFLYEQAIKYIGKKKIENLKNKEEFKGLYLGLFLTKSSYFRDFFELLNGEGTFVEHKDIERKYFNKFLKTKNGKTLMEISQYYNGINCLKLYNHTYAMIYKFDLYTELEYFKEISWDERIEALLNLDDVGTLYILKKVMKFASEKNRNIYLEMTLKKIKEDKLGNTRSFSTSYYIFTTFYLFNDRIFEKDSLEIEILSWILENYFANLYTYKFEQLNNLAKAYKLDVLRENIKLTPYQIGLSELKKNNSNEVIDISKNKLKRIINFNLRKIYLDSDITHEELKLLTVLCFDKYDDEIDEIIFKEAINLKKLNFFEYKNILNLENISHLEKLEELKFDFFNVVNFDKMKGVKYKKSLKKLEVSSFNFEKHFGIFDSFKNLEELIILSCEVELQGKQISKFINMKNLKRFSTEKFGIIKEPLENKVEKLIVRKEVNWETLIEDFLEVEDIKILFFDENLGLYKDFDVLEKFSKLKKLDLSIGEEVPLFLKNLYKYKELNTFEVGINNFHGTNICRIEADNYIENNTLEYVFIKIHPHYFGRNQFIGIMDELVDKKIQCFEISTEKLDFLYDFIKRLPKLNILEKVIINFEIEEKVVDYKIITKQIEDILKKINANIYIKIIWKQNNCNTV